MLKQCEGTLVRICLFYTRNNPEDFRDLYQERLCALWKSWPSFRGDSSRKTWVTRVALNTALYYHRSIKSMPQIIVVDRYLLDALPGESDTSLRQQLDHLIDQLESVDDREFLFLYLNNVSIYQMAQITGLSHSAVKQKLYRLRKRLIEIKEQEE